MGEVILRLTSIKPLSPEYSTVFLCCFWALEARGVSELGLVADCFVQGSLLVLYVGRYFCQKLIELGKRLNRL